MADKKGRIQALIKKNLADIILSELKSPVCEFAVVTRIELSQDYSYCKVYVSYAVDDKKVESLVGFLNNNAGKVRSKLASKLDIYKIPALSFFADLDYEKDLEMARLLDRINNTKPRTLADLDDEEK